MSGYIEREAVLDILASKNAPWDAYVKVSQLKFADVVPVVHGKWIKNDGKGWHCSVCKEIDLWAFNYEYDGEQQDRYCPNCGAKMDG